MQAQSTIFPKLPIEIRVRILAMAIGQGRRVHLDLAPAPQSNPPTVSNDGPSSSNPAAKDQSTGVAGCSEKPPHHELRVTSCGRKLNKDWAWQMTPGVRPPWSHNTVNGPWKDRCKDRAIRQHEKEDEAAVAARRNNGVVGLLLSSRSNYEETMAIMFSTNLVSVSSDDLLMEMPKYFSPHIIAAVKSLEVVWPLVVRLHQGAQNFDRPHFNAMAASIESHFPWLRRLYVSFEPAKDKETWTDSFVRERDLIYCIDKLHARLPPLPEFAVALPQSLLKAAVSQETQEEDPDCSRYALWHDTASGVNHLAQPSHTGLFPSRPMAQGAGPDIAGYWLFAGLIDGSQLLRTWETHIIELQEEQYIYGHLVRH